MNRIYRMGKADSESGSLPPTILLILQILS